MDPPLTVFVSSAIAEFLEERTALKAALEQWSFLDSWIFEEETADARPLVASYLERIEGADIVVLIVGDQPSEPVGKELAAALRTGRAILPFVKRSARANAERLFTAHHASDRFKYGVFDRGDLVPKVVEAILNEVLRRFRSDQPAAVSEAEIAELRRDYCREVVQRFLFWKSRYTPVAADVQSRDPVKPLAGLAPAEFLPRGFEVLKRSAPSRTEYVDDLKEAVDRHGDLVLLGDPGAGKSTAIWRLMLDYAERGLDDPRAPLPVLARLARYDHYPSLMDLIRAELIIAGNAGPAGRVPVHGRLARHIDALFERGTAFVMFDGLNEVPAAMQAEAIGRLSDFKRNYPRHRMLVTCRTAEYTGALAATEVRITPLDRQRQREFLERYLGEEGVRLHHTLSARDPRLLELGRNPYMLRMFAESYHLHGEIPENRSLLFRDFVGAHLERERQTRPDVWVEPVVEIAVLSDVALAMQREHGGSSVPASWIEEQFSAATRRQGRSDRLTVSRALALARSASLMEQAVDGSVRFSHQLLQEYFAALALLRARVRGPHLREAIRYPHWDEVLVLLAGLMDDSTPLIRLLIPRDPALAVRCYRVASPKPPAGILKQLVARLVKATEDLPAGENDFVPMPLGELSTPEALPLLLPLLGHPRNAVAGAASRAIARLGKDALPALVPLFDDANRDTRLSARGAIVGMKSPDVIPFVVRVLREDPGLREDAVQALWDFPPESVRPSIGRLLRSQDAAVRLAALRVVREFTDGSAPPLVMPLLDDADADVRKVATEAAGSARAEAAIPRLTAFLNGDDDRLRTAAVEALGLLKHEAVIPRLLELCGDQRADLQRAALTALGNLGAPAVLPHIAPLIAGDATARWRAALALGSLDTDLAVVHLDALARDADAAVARAAITSLTFLKPVPLSHLEPFIGHHDDRIGLKVATTLLPIAPQSAIPALIRLLKSGDMMVRWKVVEVLARLQPDVVTPSLLPLLNDAEQWVRVMTAEVLGSINARSAIPYLLPALNNPDPVDRRGAAFALGRMRVHAAIPHLLPLLNDPHGGARMGAAESLAGMTADTIPDIVPLLADPSAQIQEHIARILSTYGREQDLPQIASLLTHSSWSVRRWAEGVIAGIRRRLNLPKDYAIPAPSSARRARGRKRLARSPS